MMTDEEIIKQWKSEPASELRRLQKMPYEWKVEHAKDVIREFVEHEGGYGHVYVSFSGGKDSLVLLHLVRGIYPRVKAVFANTGIEFPEQVKFVRSFQDVDEVHPIKHFPRVLQEDGIVYPSKEIAMYVRDAKKGCAYAVNGFKGLDIEGKENRYKQRFKRWAFLLDCGVKLSPDCCKLMKEKPLRDYERQNKVSPIIGTRAEESFRRSVGWMKSGCNSFKNGHAKSTPLALWLESDVMRYIKEKGIEMSTMYKNGMRRTGCMFCPVPIAHGDLKNIRYAKEHYPKMYDVIMKKFGLEEMIFKIEEIGK